MDTDFWRVVPLSAMTKEQWDRLCDGCGKCCLLKYRETSSGQLYDSNIACNLLDVQTCRCTNYEARLLVNPECIAMTPTELDQNASQWPETCSYRLLYEGKELPAWHYLVSGSFEAVHKQPDAVSKAAVNERHVRDFRTHLRAKITEDVNYNSPSSKRD